MRRAKWVVLALALVGIGGFAIFDHTYGRPIDRCYSLKLGMSRAEVEAVMMDSPVERASDGRTWLVYPVPIVYETSPSIAFAAATGRAVEIICAERYRLKEKP